MSEERHPHTPKRVPIETLLSAYRDAGSYAAAGKVLEMDPTGIRKRIRAHLDRQLGQQNLDESIPDFKPGAGRSLTKVSKLLGKDGQLRQVSTTEQALADDDEFAHPLDKTKRVSTLRGADGSIRAQWEITVDDDAKQREAFDQIVEGFKEDIPRIKPVPLSPMRVEKVLHTNYVLSDAHIGGLAWEPESGGAWDLKIAEKLLTQAMKAMIKQSPMAQECTVALLGDWMHYDKLEAVTTLSNNVLDSDGRAPKMNKVAIRVARQVVAEALDHHQQVNVLVAEGNHDIIAANWLRELFIVAYENEPRVKVIDDPRPFYAYMQGEILHCWHHGHLKGAGKLKSAEDLVALFADEYRELWGKAKKVYVNTGHFHNAVEHEVRGARVIQHPTLATRGSYEVRNGYNALREARAQTFHKRNGICSGVYVSPEMLQGL